MHAPQRHRGNTRRAGAIIALTYAATAVFTNFATKKAGQIFPGAPDVVLSIQLLVMIISVQLLRAAGLVDWAPTSISRLISFLPLSLSYGAHAAVVLRALAHLNIPIYNVIKRLTPIMVLIAKVIIDRAAPSWGVTGSVLLTVAGCVVAGAGDLTLDLNSYALAFAAAVLQATYILLSEYLSPSGSGLAPRIISLTAFSPSTSHNSRVSVVLGNEAVSGATSPSLATDSNKPWRSQSSNGALETNWQSQMHTGQDTLPVKTAVTGSMTPTANALQALGLRPAMCVAAEAMHYAALTCLPLTLAWALMTKQTEAAQIGLAKELEREGSTTVANWILAICCIEWLLTGSIICCSQVNSALTTTVVGVLKGILAVILGFFFMGGASMTGLGLVGITMNCLGGLWYAYAKFQETGGGSDRRPLKR